MFVTVVSHFLPDGASDLTFSGRDITILECVIAYETLVDAS